MKKFLTIAFFSVFYLGAKATGICTFGAHHMDVTPMNGKKVTFKNECIQFTACNLSQGLGLILLWIDVDDSPKSYGKLKKAMDELKSKIPTLVQYQRKDNDKNGIQHVFKKSGSVWDGYQTVFNFRFEDIDKIELHYR